MQSKLGLVAFKLINPARSDQRSPDEDTKMSLYEDCRSQICFRSLASAVFVSDLILGFT